MWIQRANEFLQSAINLERSAIIMMVFLNWLQFAETSSVQLWLFWQRHGFKWFPVPHEADKTKPLESHRLTKAISMNLVNQMKFFRIWYKILLISIPSTSNTRKKIKQLYNVSTTVKASNGRRIRIPQEYAVAWIEREIKGNIYI